MLRVGYVAPFFTMTSLLFGFSADATQMSQTYTVPFSFDIPTNGGFSTGISLPSFNNTNNILQQVSVSGQFDAVLSGTYTNFTFAPFGTLIAAVNDSVDIDFGKINGGNQITTPKYPLFSVNLGTGGNVNCFGGGNSSAGSCPFSIPATFASNFSFNAVGSGFGKATTVGGTIPVSVESSVVNGTGTFTGNTKINGIIDLTYTYNALSPFQSWYNHNIVPVSNELSTDSTELRDLGLDLSAIGAPLMLVGIPAGAPLVLAEADLLGASQTLGNFKQLPLLTDPPLILPPMTPNGKFTQAIVTDFQQLLDGEFKLEGAASSLQESLQEAENLINSGSSIGSGLLEMEIAQERSALSILSGAQGSLFSKLRSDMVASGFENIPLSQADISAFINELSVNGFPSIEVSVLQEMGFSAGQITDILDQALAADISNTPNSLFAVLSQAADVHFDIAATTAVPELSTWAMMLLGFAGLGFAGFRRSAISVA